VFCDLKQEALCGRLWNMSVKYKYCAAIGCPNYSASNRKGCGGKQKVQAHWLTVDAAMTLLKDDATDESWICKKHRDDISEIAGTGGVDPRIKVLLRTDDATTDAPMRETGSTRWTSSA
jgi:hypothetical protein